MFLGQIRSQREHPARSIHSSLLDPFVSHIKKMCFEYGPRSKREREKKFCKTVTNSSVIGEVMAPIPYLAFKVAMGGTRDPVNEGCCFHSTEAYFVLETITL